MDGRQTDRPNTARAASCRCARAAQGGIGGQRMGSPIRTPVRLAPIWVRQAENILHRFKAARPRIASENCSGAVPARSAPPPDAAQTCRGRFRARQPSRRAKAKNARRRSEEEKRSRLVRSSRLARQRATGRSSQKKSENGEREADEAISRSNGKDFSPKCRAGRSSAAANARDTRSRRLIRPRASV